jgi:hypothetical protein
VLGGGAFWSLPQGVRCACRSEGRARDVFYVMGFRRRDFRREIFDYVGFRVVVAGRP